MITLSIYSLSLILYKCVQDDPDQDHLLHYGRFVISPLRQGEGNTLGTAIRRSLLNLQGFSIQSAKIFGAHHEYDLLNGILESVHEILTNLKKIVFVGNNQENIHASIVAEGIGSVNASYIKLPENVSIINAKEHIATLTKSNSKLCIDIDICKKNNRDINTKNSNKNKDYFNLDYISVPIKNVNYTVHPITYTEERTEMLVIEIWTNKSVSPNQALNDAASHLISLLQIFSLENNNSLSSNYNIISNKNIYYKNDIEYNVDKKKKSDKTDFDQINISSLNLSTRTYNSLHKANIYTISDLLKYSEADLLRIKNFGRRSAEQVIKSLKEIGITLD